MDSGPPSPSGVKVNTQVRDITRLSSAIATRENVSPLLGPQRSTAAPPLTSPTLTPSGTGAPGWALRSYISVTMDTTTLGTGTCPCVLLRDGGSIPASSVKVASTSASAFKSAALHQSWGGGVSSQRPRADLPPSSTPRSRRGTAARPPAAPLSIPVKKDFIGQEDKTCPSVMRGDGGASPRCCADVRQTVLSVYTIRMK